MSKFPFMAVFTVLACCFLSLVYGAVSMQMRWWPSQLIVDAGNAAVALWSVREDEFAKNWPTSMEFFETSDLTGPTVISHVTAAGNPDDLFFVDGGNQQLRSHCPDNGCIAWVLDRSGRIRHVWDIGSQLVWQGIDHIDGFSDPANIYSVGAHAFPNGDLLVTYQGRNTYPYGIGMARFDKDSNLLWKKPNFAHHWFSVDADGLIYVPAFAAVQAPHVLGDTHLEVGCREGALLQEDVILVLNPDGEEVDRISVLDALAASDYAGLAFQAIHSDRELPLVWPECDPTHLNDVRIISAAAAATTPHLNEGDLLISLRSNNAVLAINKDTHEVSWASVGRTALQHSPRYMGDNTVLIFDNLGGAKSQGGSRLVRLNMDTFESKSVYPRPGEAVDNVLSQTGGHIGLDPDSNRALMAITHQGRVVEVDLDSGQLLWEYLNIHDVGDVLRDDNGRGVARFAVQTMTYFNDADFEFNEGKP